MRAYVINLARSTERREHMGRELLKSGVDYEFVEAVEGRDLDLSETTLIDSTWLGDGPYWAGAVGCYLSHLKVHQKVLETDAACALVLEDDVLLPGDLKELVEAIAEIVAGSEAVLLHHHRSGSAVPGEATRLLTRDSIRLPGSRLLAIPTRVSDLGGTGAYVITREACLRMVETMLPVQAFVDDWAFFNRQGVLDTVRCVEPMPVPIDTRFRTTIDHYAARSVQTRLRNAVTTVPVLRQALTLRRRRLMERNTRVEVVDEG